MNVDNLLKKINKENDNNAWFTAINLTNAYLTYSFQGTEHDLLKKKYADFIFINILPEVKKLYYKNVPVKQKIFEKSIWLARLKTYKYRNECYYTWFNNISKEIPIVSDKLIQSLFTFYKLKKQYKNVKNILGLNYTLKDINEKLKELK
ncbi:MAG: hypothetical protein ACTSXT_13325 [Candidatus Helarchaeota archaeon]